MVLARRDSMKGLAKRCFLYKPLLSMAVVCAMFCQPMATAQDSILTVEVPNGPSIELVWVEGGTFTMGSNSGINRRHQYDANRPEHQVSVRGFYMGCTEVTQRLWKAVMDTNPSVFVGDSLPVDNVTWTEAQQFVTLISQLTGLRFRLPREAEWEYAARGGIKAQGNLYAGCNRQQLADCAWYCVNSERRVHPVALLGPNELGLYDMSGNVAEWCLDWMAPYDSKQQTDPSGPASGDSRILRGGHYNSVSAACSVFDRSWYEPAAASEYFGMRLVLEPDEGDGEELPVQ